RGGGPPPPPGGQRTGEAPLRLRRAHSPAGLTSCARSLHPCLLVVQENRERWTCHAFRRSSSQVSSQRRSTAEPPWSAPRPSARSPGRTSAQTTARRRR